MFNIKLPMTIVAVVIIGFVAAACSDETVQVVSGSGDNSTTTVNTGEGGTEVNVSSCGDCTDDGGVGTRGITPDGEAIPAHCPLIEYPSCPEGTTIRSDCSCESRSNCVCVWPQSSDA